MTFRRVIWVVLDSVGIGEMPDAARYGDAGSDTLGNIARLRTLRLPNLTRLGLANIKRLTGLPPVQNPEGAFGKCTLASPGKDTTTGHWEMAGIHLKRPFPLFPNGFPPEVMQPFEDRIGRGTLGNCVASGTEIIRELGEEHVRTGKPIVYTSADSVFQIAAHEDILSVAELYRICEIAREILRGPYEVGRVIARPFAGKAGSFIRTTNRHDYAVAPPQGMLLDKLEQKGIPVHGIGKISDVFLGRGITRSDKTISDADGMEKTLSAMQATDEGVIWTNLVDFDMLFGHRNNVDGYAHALEEVDSWVPSLVAALRPGDLAIFCADHGCDPTTPSTDHSREYTPLLVFGPSGRSANLGTRASLSDIGQTVAGIFGTRIPAGESFLDAVG